MNPQDIDEYFHRYVRLCHADPDPDVGPTTDQLTALTHVLKSNFAPYVHFARWGPHNDRFQRQRSFHGLMLGPDGVFTKVELRGLSSIEAWSECFPFWPQL